MGRPAMTDEQINQNRIKIIKAARELINSDGLKSISARTLSSKVGMNTSSMYRFFTDLDEIVLFACVNALQDYVTDFIKAEKELESNLDIASDENYYETLYIKSWEVFCTHAFSHPVEFSMLFFSKHSDRLRTIMSEYYKLFSDDIDRSPDYVLNAMFRTHNLSSRNLMLLIPVLEGQRSEDEILTTNDLTIAYFYTLLSEATREPGKMPPDVALKKMLKVCRFLNAL